MARGILTLLFLVSRLAAAQSCSSATGDAQSLQQQTKAGPIYKALAAQTGRPLTCRLDVDGGRITVTYTFRSHSELRVQVDPAIESNEQRIQTRMPLARAITLLKAAEQEAYKPGGCGIAWDRPAEQSATSNSQEAVYRGTTCNCQARFTSRGNFAVSFVLKSAC